jgi:hypothetical protein
MKKFDYHHIVTGPSAEERLKLLASYMEQLASCEAGSRSLCQEIPSLFIEPLRFNIIFTRA